MIELKEGYSVKVTPLDNTIYKTMAPITGKVFELNSNKSEMIVVGYQGDVLKSHLITLNNNKFLVKKTRIPKQVTERIELYTRANFYRLPLKDIAFSKNTYREVFTKSFDVVTITNVKKFRKDLLRYRYYDFTDPYNHAVKTIRVMVENGELTSEGLLDFKNDNINVAKLIHSEIKNGIEKKVYVISHKGEFIYTTLKKEELYWNLNKLLVNKEKVNINDLELFTNKI